MEIQTLRGSTSPGTRGQSAKTFGTVATVWANVEQLRGNEAVIAKQIDARSTHAVEMHYTPHARPPARLKIGTRELNILSADNDAERNRTSTLICMELTT